METTNSLIVKVGNEVTLTETVGDIIKSIEDEVSAASHHESEMRTAILNAMLDNNIDSAKVKGYTVSLVFGKSTWSFNKEAFITEQDVDVTAAFTTIEEIEEFDLETFKAENPELYKKYCKTTQSIVVDEKRLCKMLPSLYNKYATEIKSTKAPTLRIAKSKEK